MTTSKHDSEWENKYSAIYQALVNSGKIASEVKTNGDETIHYLFIMVPVVTVCSPADVDAGSFIEQFTAIFKDAYARQSKVHPALKKIPIRLLKDVFDHIENKLQSLSDLTHPMSGYVVDNASFEEMEDIYTRFVMSVTFRCSTNNSEQTNESMAVVTEVAQALDPSNNDWANCQGSITTSFR